MRMRCGETDSLILTDRFECFKYTQRECRGREIKTKLPVLGVT